MFNGTKENPFVQAGLDILMDYDEGGGTLPELVARLAARQPLLSPVNLECAAREALRQAPDYRAAIAEGARAEEIRRIAAAARAAEAEGARLAEEREAVEEAHSADIPELAA
jgi:hypothetical protein